MFPTALACTAAIALPTPPLMQTSFAYHKAATERATAEANIST